MQIQFNWIFIIIAGSVLLMFFVKIAGDYKSKSERDIAQEVLDKIGSIASTGQLSSRSSSIIEVKGLELQTGCVATTCNQKGCSAEFDFKGQGFPAPTWMEMEPVFASKHIRGGNLIMWSLPWKAPYKVSNFLYLTSADHKFVFVYDEDESGSEQFARKAYNKFTENEYVEATINETDEIQQISYNGEDMIKFVFSYKPPEDFTVSISEGVSEHNWDVLYLEGDMSKGEVYFSEFDEERGDKVPGPSYSYYGAPMLMGAIYSDDINDYKCNVRKAMLNYIRMNDMYYQRSKRLENHYSSSSSSCDSFYAQAAISIERMNSSAINSSFDLEKAGEIETESENLEKYDHQAQENDCPRIY